MLRLKDRRANVSVFTGLGRDNVAFKAAIDASPAYEYNALLAFFNHINQKTLYSKTPHTLEGDFKYRGIFTLTSSTTLRQLHFTTFQQISRLLVVSVRESLSFQLFDFNTFPLFRHFHYDVVRDREPGVPSLCWFV